MCVNAANHFYTGCFQTHLSCFSESEWLTGFEHPNWYLGEAYCTSSFSAVCFPKNAGHVSSMSLTALLERCCSKLRMGFRLLERSVC